jgi:hypothetical protein
LRIRIGAAVWLAFSWRAGWSAECQGFRADRLRMGAFRYRTLVNGKEAGSSEIRIRRSRAGTFEFTNEISGAFRQSWAAVASAEFVPVSARLSSASGTVFELTYRGDRVTGSAGRVVDDVVAAGTVDQRIDWAAVMSMREYGAGGTCGFRVYDPKAGNSRVVVTIGGKERIRVPAGMFDTVRVVYRIAKAQGTEEYRVWMGGGARRFMVREEFPNGSVTELAAMGR